MQIRFGSRMASDARPLDGDTVNALAEGWVPFQKVLVIVSTAIHTPNQAPKSVQGELTLKRFPFGVTKVPI
jgi:hypothetical protein